MPAEPRPHRDPFGLDGRSLLPDTEADETDEGWGEHVPGSSRDDPGDLRRFLDDKPPHHL